MNEIIMPPEEVDRLASLSCICLRGDAECYCSEVRNLAAEVVRLRATREACARIAERPEYGQIGRDIAEAIRTE